MVKNMKKLKTVFFFLFLSSITLYLYGQKDENKIVLKTEVSSNSISINDSIVFKLYVKGKRIPTKIYNTQEILKDFKIIRQKSSLRTKNDIFLGRVREREITWMLKPIRSGELTIPSLKIKYGGKEYSTYPITIFVSEENLQSENSVLKVIVYPSENDVLVNQQVVLSFSLITNISINSVIIKEPLILSNVWVEEFPETGKIKGEQITDKGKTYYKYIIKRYAIFPQKAGRVIIPPITFEISTTDNKTLYRKSNKLILNVKRLPPSLTPRDFMYLVGSFWVKSSVDKIKTKIGENIRYTIKISGDGNIKSVQPPKFQTNRYFNVYPPEVKVELNYEGNKINGTKEWTFLMVPQKRGLLKIPSFCFWFYLPDKKIFKNTCTRSFSIMVEAPFYSKSIKIFREKLPPPETETKYLSEWETPFFLKFINVVRIIIGLIILEMITFLLFLYCAKRRNKKVASKLNVKRELRKIRKEKNHTIFCKKILSLVNKFFFYRYNRWLLDEGIGSLKEFLVKKEIKESKIKELIELIVFVQTFMYSPEKNKTIDKKEIIDKLLRIFKELTEEKESES